MVRRLIEQAGLKKTTLGLLNQSEAHISVEPTEFFGVNQSINILRNETTPLEAIITIGKWAWTDAI